MPCLTACFLEMIRPSDAINPSTSDSASAMRRCSSTDSGHATSTSRRIDCVISGRSL